MFESNQFKEAVKQELENSHPELVERFDQDVELPSYNVISEEQKLAQLEEQLEEIDYLTKTKNRLTSYLETNDKINEDYKSMIERLNSIIEESKQTIDALKETNNQLFLANENLNKELNEIKQNNVGLNKWMTEKFNEKDQKINSLTETNNQLFSNNIDLEEQVNDLENEVKELRNDLIE